MDPKKQLVYRFLSLPYTQIIEIAVGLRLLTDQDKGVEDLELFKRFIARAEKRGRETMAQLWDLVEDKYRERKKHHKPLQDKLIGEKTNGNEPSFFGMVRNGLPQPIS